MKAFLKTVNRNYPGFFCGPLDAATMRNAVEEILAGSDVASEIAKAAKQKARERFHPEATAAQHVEIYKHVLAQNKNRMVQLQLDAVGWPSCACLH